MPNMSLEVVLKLVDQLTGPTRGAATALNEFAEAAEKIGGGAPKPDGWVEQQQEIGKAKDKVEDYKQSISGATSLIDDATKAIIGFTLAHKGLELARSTILAGAEAVHAQVSAETSGATPEDIKATDEAAGRLSARYPTLTETSIKDSITRIRAISGNTEEAIKAEEILAPLKIIQHAEMPGGEEGFENLMRGLEVWGAAKDEKTLGRAVDIIAKSINVAKGTIRPEDYNEFFKYLGSAYARNLDPAFVAGAAMTVIGELRGSSAGVALRALEGVFFQDKIAGKVARRVDELGLIADETKVHRSKSGTIEYLDPGALVDPELALHNPYQWLGKYLKPALDKAGASELERTELLSGLFVNSQAFQAADILMNQGWRVERDTELTQNAPGREAADTWLTKDLGTAWEALWAQWENTKKDAAAPLAPAETAAVTAAREGLTGWNEGTKGNDWLNTEVIGAMAAAAVRGGLALMKMIPKLGDGGRLGSLLSAADQVLGAAVPFLGLANIAAWTPPEDQQVLDAAIAREKAEAEAHKPAFSGSTDPTSYENRIAAKRALRAAGYMPGDVEAEEAREASRGRALSPSLNVGALDDASAKAKDANQQLQALGAASVAPKVDSSALDALLTKLREAASLVGSINGGLSRASPRASFAGALHDGPEAR
jgi:hypothetical protein